MTIIRIALASAGAVFFALRWLIFRELSPSTNGSYRLPLRETERRIGAKALITIAKSVKNGENDTGTIALARLFRRSLRVSNESECLY